MSSYTPELREIRRQARIGWVFPQEVKNKISQTLTGKKHTDERKLKNKLARVGIPLGPPSEAHRNNLREAALRRLGKDPKYSNTSIEVSIKEVLVARGILFEHQKRLGKFLVDFYLPDYNVVIECDGCYWHCCNLCGRRKETEFTSNLRLLNECRDTKLIQTGYDVWHFWEHEINKSPSDCIDRLCLGAYPKVEIIKEKEE